MNCPDVIARLAEPAAAADTEVRAHLATCADCCRDASAVEALLATASSPPPEKLERFAARVKARLVAQQDRAQRATPWRSGLIAGACAAAATVAVALVLQLAFPTSPRSAGVLGNPVVAVTDGEPSGLTPKQIERLMDQREADELTLELVAGDEYAFADEDDDDWGGEI
jgi:hypothetical protein